MKSCINCGKEILLGLLCRACRKKIPSGFSLKSKPDELLAEIKRNEKVRSKFHADMTLGKLQVDTVNRLFHIDNGYYRILDLEGFNFYTGEPRFSYGITRKVWEDIYFAFTLRGQQRRVRRLLTVPCPYQKSSRIIRIEPPLSMMNMKQLFQQMQADERERMRTLLQKGMAMTEQDRYIIEMVSERMKGKV